MTDRPRPKKGIAWAAFGVGFLMLAVPLLFRTRIQEEWLIWQLTSADEGTQIRIGRRLGALKSVRAIPALLDMEPSEWEQQWIGYDPFLEKLFDESTGSLETRSPALSGLRSLGEAAAAPLLFELERFGEELPDVGDWTEVQIVRFGRVVGALALLPEAQSRLSELWETSEDAEVRAMAVLALSWMEDSPDLRNVLRRIADSWERVWLPKHVLARLKGLESGK